MRAFFLLLFFSSIGSSLYSQEAAPPAPAIAQNALYGELGGAGMEISANYDRRLTNSNGGLGIRVGIGSSIGDGPSAVTVPLGLNYLVGGHKGNFIELGAGTTFLNIDHVDAAHTWTLGHTHFATDTHTVMGNLVLGYRRQPKHGGLSVRAGFAPFIGAGTSGMIPYFSLGYCF